MVLNPRPGADSASMRAAIVALVVVNVVVFLGVGACQEIYPDVDGPRREVERVLPAHFLVLSVSVGICRPPDVGGCGIVYELSPETEGSDQDREAIRENLKANGWAFDRAYSKGEIRFSVHFLKPGDAEGCLGQRRECLPSVSASP